MDHITSFFQTYPSVVLAVALLGMLVVVLKVAFAAPVHQVVSEAHADDEPRLQADLGQWAADLRLFARSLLLGRWHDVGYALRWCTVTPPSSLMDALDWNSFGQPNTWALRCGRICSQAEDLSATAVVVDGVAMLPGAATTSGSTIAFSASDYARAVMLLADDVENLCANLGRLEMFDDAIAHPAS